MRALAFKSKIKNNKIYIPADFLSEFANNKNKSKRVIVLIDDLEIEEEQAFQQFTKDQFLEGYADSDSIYN